MNNNLNVDELKQVIKWAQATDKELLTTAFLSLIGLRPSEIVSLRLE